MANYLLDTTALVDFLRGRQGILEMFNALSVQGNRLGACCVSIAELYAGVSQERRTAADRLTGVLDYYDVSPEAAKEAGRYRFEFARRGIALSTADTLIAATAIDQGAILVTGNTKDFPMEEIQLLEHP
ncbi:MAG: hypothetical protein BZY81_05620 [SAR202 cluster bacterium Io17-Chloro-G4]|nr:MAG: hypothetical protein BZY81_05620 [SAR202 cluster bacterium Io17-Chloro-G4]